jgi:PAS domain S-box-containing protein
MTHRTIGLLISPAGDPVADRHPERGRGEIHGRHTHQDGSEAEEPSTYFPPLGTTHMVLPLSPDEQQLADRARELIFDAELAGLVVEHLPDAMVMVDEAGVIRRVNAKAERLFGYPRAEMLGQRIGILLPEDRRQTRQARRDAYMADPHVRPMGLGLALHARHKNGTEVPVDMNLAPVVTTRGVWVIAAVRRTR